MQLLLHTRLLSAYLGLGRRTSEQEAKDGGRAGCLSEKEKIVLDFHYYNYAFCKERRFDARATSTFLSILKDVFDEASVWKNIRLPNPG